MAFNGRFVLNLAHFAAKLGGDLDELINLSGHSIEKLQEEDCIVENANYNAVIERAVASTKDPCFGLHAGENLNLAAAGLIVQLSQSSKTVKEALQMACEYANLGCSVLPMQLEEKETFYRIFFDPDPEWREQSEVTFQHTAAGVIAFKIKEFHSLTRLQHRPISVNLNWTDRENRKEYERAYGCQVKFGAKEMEVLLNKEQVEDKVITSNYSLLQALVSHAEELVASVDSQSAFSSVVKNSVIQLMKPEFPSLEQVASHLNISSRTLQRRLNEMSTSYKEVIDELKKDFAIKYLKKGELSLSEIAYLLSYGDGSAFSRSFKRWTGQTPGEYRAALIL